MHSQSLFRCFQPCHDPEVRAAIKRNDGAALSSLLDRPRCLGLTGSNINVPLDGADGSALHMAAAAASESLVREILKRGAQVNAINVAGETPLHLAARRGSVPVVEVLLSIEVVRVDALDLAGSSPLMLAAMHGHWAVVRLLLAANATPSPSGARHDAECAAPLRRAAEALAMCAALWPAPTVRYCAIGRIGHAEPLASCTPHSAPSGWADGLGNAETQRGAEMLRRVMGSSRIKEHPRLTVSTESGMLHYELQPQSQLMFLAITLADLPQSAAFTFLNHLRTRFVAQVRGRPTSLRRPAPLSNLAPTLHTYFPTVLTPRCPLPPLLPTLPPPAPTDLTVRDGDHIRVGPRRPRARRIRPHQIPLPLVPPTALVRAAGRHRCDPPRRCNPTSFA